MIKTITWIIVVAILIGAGYYALNSDIELKKIDTIETENINLTKEENLTNIESKKMSFKDFLKQGGSYKCEVNQYINGIESKGITYINNGMIRGEYNSKIQNIIVDSIFIVRDGYTYSWTSMAPNMGFKVKVIEGNEVNSSNKISGTYNWNAEQIGDYNCEAWMVDSSKFTIPTNITFQELGG